MDLVLVIIVVLGSLIALAAAIFAVRAWLNLLKTQSTLQNRFKDEAPGSRRTHAEP